MDQHRRLRSCLAAAAFTLAAVLLFPIGALAKSSPKQQHAKTTHEKRAHDKKTHEAKDARKHGNSKLAKHGRSKHAEARRKARHTEDEASEKPATPPLTGDLGALKDVAALRLRLNPQMIWQARTQEIAVLASDDGQAFQTVLPAGPYHFDPAANANTVTIAVTARARFLRLSFTANDGATGGQLAEWEVFGP